MKNLYNKLNMFNINMEFVNDKTVDNIIEKYSKLNNESQKAATLSAE